MELARRFERRSRTYGARALPTELHQHKLWRWRGELHSRMICFAGRCLAVLATPPKTLERAARVELASSGWRPEAPAAIPCSLLQTWRSQRELNRGPQHAPVLLFLRVLGWLEPVPPDRQSGILPARLCDRFANMRREQPDTVVFLAKEVTVAFTTPRTSIHSKSGCRRANRTGIPSTRRSCFCACWGGRTLMTSFKDSRPAIERPGINIYLRAQQRSAAAPSRSVRARQRSLLAHPFI